jgi:hypothetical protein
VVWDNWRFNGEGELYDISKDPGQEKDVSSQFPKMLRELKQYYDDYWASIEDSIEVVEPIVVGHDAEPYTDLTCNNWVEVDFDNRGKVAGGDSMGGIWQIEVEKSGKYSVQLSRWPFHMDLELTAIGPATTIGVMPIDSGRVFPIKSGSLNIDGERAAMGRVNASNTAVDLEIELDAGRHTMQGWFHGKSGERLTGSFYGRVSRL